MSSEHARPAERRPVIALVRIRLAQRACRQPLSSSSMFNIPCPGCHQWGSGQHPPLSVRPRGDVPRSPGRSRPRSATGSRLLRRAVAPEVAAGCDPCGLGGALESRGGPRSNRIVTLPERDVDAVLVVPDPASGAAPGVGARGTPCMRMRGDPGNARSAGVDRSRRGSIGPSCTSHACRDDRDWVGKRSYAEAR